MSAHGRAPAVSVRLFDHYSSKVYGAGSPIRGEVIITAPRSTPFGSLEITFMGLARTAVVVTHVPQQSSLAFLRLTMPIPEHRLPRRPRVLEADRPLAVPFNFVVPAHLTLSACRHAPARDGDPQALHDHHTRLPPTMGPGAAAWSRDDMSPETAQIEYYVRARLIAEPSCATAATTRSAARSAATLAEARAAIRVMTPSPEDAPLAIGPADKMYAMTKTKNVRKGVFGGRLGRLTATATQPPAILLSPDGRAASASGVTVRLSFEPRGAGAAAAPPPRIRSVAAKLSSTTYYGVTPSRDLPDRGGRSDFPVEPPRPHYRTSVPLLSADLAADAVTWRQEKAPLVRRDSGYSTSHGTDVDDGSTRGGMGPAAAAHEATIFIPFEVPTKNKTILPTFHSCLVSRVYALHLTVTAGPANTAVSLVVPVQVAAEPTDEALKLALALGGGREAEVAEADEYLRPRLLRVPGAECELPGYA